MPGVVRAFSRYAEILGLLSPELAQFGADLQDGRPLNVIILFVS